MGTVPTSRLERDLRKLFVSWVNTLPADTGRPEQYLDRFKRQSLALINKRGGQIARLGVSSGFPAPKELDLATVAGHIYSDMELAVVRAQIMTGLNARESARALLRAGVQKEYYRLERMARTETVRAYWANQRAEANDLGLVLLWGVERGPRTCQWCIERDGLVVDDGAHDHPNGRCTLIPTLPSLVDYRGSVARDGSIYQDPDWDKQFSTGVLYSDVGSEYSSSLKPWGDDYALDMTDPDLISARKTILDQHSDNIAAVAKSKRMSPEDFRDTLEKSLQDLVDKSSVTVHLDPDHLLDVLQNGLKTAWDTGTNAFGDLDDAYFHLRKRTEQLNWKGDSRPIYGKLDIDGDAAGLLYGRAQIVLNDSVKDRATVTFFDSINHASEGVASPLTSVSADSIRSDYIMKQNFSRGWKPSDLISEYAEVQMSSVKSSDIKEIVIWHYSEETPVIDEALSKMAESLGIPIRTRVIPW